MTYKLKLTNFEGPLDLLLHLIKLNEVDIYDIPIATITEQYVEYLKMMEQLDLEIASEFLVMAATLVEIKSRMLLPTQPGEEEQEDDPRFELIEQILEYKKYKELADNLDHMAAVESTHFQRNFKEEEDLETGEPLIEVSLFELLQAFKRVLEYATEEPFREITLEEVSIEEKMEEIRALLKQKGNILLDEIFGGAATTKVALISTFLALLELIRLKEVVARQTKLFAEIRIFLLQKG
ncbi:MAG: segregation/condensation protein A [Candidatus Abyssobacteria bacterium SURF_17]|jgi:segregation and condensation protein A|uniref:Segregation and condensation protein A n=1 Tax=Candidatus Abyssobacteria bacterium SURF_17 TaxID=2093361 RepID=A0A419F859_9BACT|nr:MAG: segregation/condensation protein A [Candidatus Abyssubacteria bacterium SURF_17]